MHPTETDKDGSPRELHLVGKIIAAIPLLAFYWFWHEPLRDHLVRFLDAGAVSAGLYLAYLFAWYLLAALLYEVEKKMRSLRRKA